MTTAAARPSPSAESTRAGASSLREVMRSADLLVGTVLSTRDPLMAEAVSGSGVDFVMIDGEHGGLDARDITASIMAANIVGTPTFVRLAGDDPVKYMQPLDAGADGLIVPRVKTAADVRRAVDLARYPPTGSRGYGPLRAGGYGRREAAYVANANAETVLIVQIETREALDSLDEILSTEELDGVLIGRNDLSGSLGLPRDHKHPELLSICRDVLALAREKRLVRGIAAGIDPKAVPELHAMGANLVMAGGDVEFLVKGLGEFLADVGAHGPGKTGSRSA